MDVIFVNYFTARRTPEAVPIAELSAAFGNNIPRYLPLEGSHADYLFCVNMEPADIHAICKKYGYAIVGMHWDESTASDALIKEMYQTAFTSRVVDATLYNNCHIASINYCRGGEYRVLKPMETDIRCDTMMLGCMNM
jgi:hypothetical protein